MLPAKKKKNRQNSLNFALVFAAISSKWNPHSLLVHNVFDAAIDEMKYSSEHESKNGQSNQRFHRQKTSLDLWNESLADVGIYSKLVSISLRDYDSKKKTTKNWFGHHSQIGLHTRETCISVFRWKKFEQKMQLEVIFLRRKSFFNHGMSML